MARYTLVNQLRPGHSRSSFFECSKTWRPANAKRTNINVLQEICSIFASLRDLLHMCTRAVAEFYVIRCYSMGLKRGCMAFGLSLHPPTPSPGSALHPTPYPNFSGVALVMSFSRGALLQLSMMLVRLSGAKSLLDPWVSQLLGEWVA